MNWTTPVSAGVFMRRKDQPRKCAGSALAELPGNPRELFHRFSVLNLSIEFSFHRFLSNVKWMSQSKGEQYGQDGEKLLANGEQTASERIPSNYGGNRVACLPHLLGARRRSWRCAGGLDPR